MNQQNAEDRLRKATAEAAFQIAAESERIRFRPDPSPCPGDTFLFHQTGDFAVEWAIVERDPEDARRLLVVPVDDYPQVGSCDVELNPGHTGPVANVRCDLTTWLDASRFQVKLRTGALAPENVERVRRKRSDIETRTLTASIPEEEVDGDPEYRRWRKETLQGALKALADVAAEISEAARPAGRRWWAVAGGPLALAASVLLVVTVGSMWEMRELRDQLVEERERAGVLGQEKGELEQRLADSGTEVRELREQYRNLEQESTQAIAELDQHRSRVAELRQKLTEKLFSEAEPNLPFVFFRSEEGSSRGSPRQLIIAPEARWVALFVPVIDPEFYPGYRLQIVDKASDEEIWTADQFVLEEAVLSVSLPASLFESGDYELRLYGLSDEGTKRLEERYVLEIRKESGIR